MPETPVYALPYPLGTDPAYVPADVRALADRLEVVLPTVAPPAEGVSWEGAWASGTAYTPGDIVSYNGRYWLAAQANTGSAPS